MKLSTRCRYGVRAMIEIARNYKKGPLKRKEITRLQGISHSYLENILISLKSRKLITTTRGAQGGFVLEIPPDRVTLYDIVTALEGSIAPVECLDNAKVCDKSGTCVARSAWNTLHQAQITALTGISLQDLLNNEKKGNALHYTI